MSVAGRDKNLGIDDDYYVAVAPDPNDTEAARLLDELVELTGEGRGLS